MIIELFFDIVCENQLKLLYKFNSESFFDTFCSIFFVFLQHILMLAVGVQSFCFFVCFNFNC